MPEFSNSFIEFTELCFAGQWNVCHIFTHVKFCGIEKEKCGRMTIIMCRLEGIRVFWGELPFKMTRASRELLNYKKVSLRQHVPLTPGFITPTSPPVCPPPPAWECVQKRSAEMPRAEIRVTRARVWEEQRAPHRDWRAPFRARWFTRIKWISLVDLLNVQSQELSIRM